MCVCVCVCVCLGRGVTLSVCEWGLSVGRKGGVLQAVSMGFWVGLGYARWVGRGALGWGFQVLANGHGGGGGGAEDGLQSIIKSLQRVVMQRNCFLPEPLQPSPALLQVATSCF